MFLGIKEVPQRVIDINSVERDSVERDILSPKNSNKNSSKEQARIKLINKINWLLMVICGIAFLVIIIYSIVYPDKSIPDIIQNAFFTTLGWFGGALGTFFQIDQNEK